MTKKQKKMLVRIIITAVMLVGLKFIPLTGIPQLAAYLIAYLVIGYDILKKAGKGILNGRAFDENFLMAIATLGAFFLAVWTKSGDYVEGRRDVVLSDRRAVPDIRCRRAAEHQRADGVIRPGIIDTSRLKAAVMTSDEVAVGSVTSSSFC